MKTINAIVMGSGEMTSEIVSNLFTKNKFRLEHSQIRIVRW